MNQCETAASTVTLRAVFEEYKLVRELKPVTIRNYEGRINGHLADWLELDVRAISRDMIEEKFLSIKSKSIANATMRTLRALLFFAANAYDDNAGAPLLKNNPVRRLSQTKIWHKDGSRRDVIQVADIAKWTQAVYSIPNPTVRDMLLTLLFTGMRLCEVKNLHWSQVNLAQGTIYLSDTKNGASRTVPLSDFVWRLLAVRKYCTTSDFVFPSPYDNTPISANTKTFKLAVQRSGFQWSYHTMRRTFVSVADELEIPSELVAELVGHKRDSIHEGYVVRSTERLRRVTQKITNALLVYAGFMESKPTIREVKSW